MPDRGKRRPQDGLGLDRRSFLHICGISVGSLLLPGAAGQTTLSEDWPQYGRDRSNTASNAESGGIKTKPTKEWDLDVKSPVKSGITVANDTVYAFGSNGDIFAVDNMGNVMVFAVGAGSTTSNEGNSAENRTATPAIADGALFIGGLDGTVYALDVESKTQLWSSETNNPIRASPVIGKGSVFISNTGGEIYAYDQVNGSEQWSTTLGARTVATPALSDSALFVADTQGTVTALRPDTGESIWTFDAEAAIPASLTLSTSDVFVATDSGTIYAVSRDNGERNWDGAIPGSVIASPALGENSLFVADMEGAVTAFDTNTGTQKWQINTGGPIVGDPALGSDTLYLATRDGTILALDRADGSERWDLEVDAEVLSPLTIAGGLLYVGRPDGHILSIKEDSGIVAIALTYGESAIQTITRNKGVATGIAGLGAVSVGGYAGFKRYRESGTPATSNEEPSLGTEATGEAAAIADSPTLDQQFPDLSGVSYEDFDTEEVIGSGGSADVHRAVVNIDGNDHTIALKTPRMSDYETVDSSFFEEFVNEAEIWEDIDDHEAIVSVLGWGQQPYPWIALEYMEAGNLDELLADIDLETALGHIEQICDAVHHAHRYGVTHTDLKPENVLYTSVDGTLVPKVTDWGLANVLIKHSTSVQGMTPAYAAPEQIEPTGYGGTDDRTDIYQLGVIAYELLTGQRPFDHDNYTATMNAILNESPRPPAELAEAVEPVLSDVVQKALKKNKDQRYETALHFRDAIRRAYHEGQR